MKKLFFVLSLVAALFFSCASNSAIRSPAPTSQNTPLTTPKQTRQAAKAAKQHARQQKKLAKQQEKQQKKLAKQQAKQQKQIAKMAARQPDLNLQQPSQTQVAIQPQQQPTQPQVTQQPSPPQVTQQPTQPQASQQQSPPPRQPAQQSLAEYQTWVTPSVTSGYKPLVLDKQMISGEDVFKYGGVSSWYCTSRGSSNGQVLFEVGFFSKTDTYGYVLFDNTNEGTKAYHHRDGLNHRWDWGRLKDGGYKYSVVIEPDGSALYYEFIEGERAGRPRRLYDAHKR